MFSGLAAVHVEGSLLKLTSRTSSSSKLKTNINISTSSSSKSNNSNIMTLTNIKTSQQQQQQQQFSSTSPPVTSGTNASSGTSPTQPTATTTTSSISRIGASQQIRMRTPFTPQTITTASSSGAAQIASNSASSRDNNVSKSVIVPIGQSGHRLYKAPQASIRGGLTMSGAGGGGEQQQYQYQLSPPNTRIEESKLGHARRRRAPYQSSSSSTTITQTTTAMTNANAGNGSSINCNAPRRRSLTDNLKAMSYHEGQQQQQQQQQMQQQNQQEQQKRQQSNYQHQADLLWQRVTMPEINESNYSDDNGMKQNNFADTGNRSFPELYFQPGTTSISASHSTATAAANDATRSSPPPPATQPGNNFLSSRGTGGVMSSSLMMPPQRPQSRSLHLQQKQQRKQQRKTAGGGGFHYNDDPSETGRTDVDDDFGQASFYNDYSEHERNAINYNGNDVYMNVANSSSSNNNIHSSNHLTMNNSINMPGSSSKPHSGGGSINGSSNCVKKGRRFLKCFGGSPSNGAGERTHGSSNGICMRRSWTRMLMNPTNVVQFVVLLLLAGIIFDSHHKNRQHRVVIQHFDEERSHLLDQMMWLNKAAKKIHNKYTESQFHKNLESETKPELIHEAEKLREELDQLQLRIQANARDEIHDLVGDNPLQVTLQYHNQEAGETVKPILILLSDDAPHAVSTFLQQINKKKWDELFYKKISESVIQVTSKFPTSSPLLEFVEPSRGCRERGSVALFQKQMSNSDSEDGGSGSFVNGGAEGGVDGGGGAEVENKGMNSLNMIVLRIQMQDNDHATSSSSVCIGKVLDGLQHLQELTHA